jgi:hypothetical protein
MTFNMLIKSLTEFKNGIKYYKIARIRKVILYQEHYIGLKLKTTLLQLNSVVVHDAVR